MKAERIVAQDVRKAFSEQGFQVVEAGDNPEAIEVKKYNCAQRIARTQDGPWQPAGPPLFIVRGLECKLEDRGYQKFWNHEGKRLPIRLSDLQALHRFDQEVRMILGLRSLYHESLGTTSARSGYDRLEGRPDR